MNTPLDLGQQIASDAMNDIGHAYILGGAPGPNFDKPWDCSSAVNKWLGHDFGMRLPGTTKAGYDGTSHGPGSWQYITWSGAKTVGGPPQAGDLLIWPGTGALGHIGIAISATDMVSALNPELGTMRTPIISTKPGIHIIRRIDGSAVNANPGCPIPGLMIALVGMERVSAAYSLRRNRSARA